MINTQVGNAKDTDLVMPMYNLIEDTSDTYSETSGSLCQYYRDEPVLNVNAIIDFPDDNNSASFKF